MRIIHSVSCFRATQAVAFETKMQRVSLLHRKRCIQQGSSHQPVFAHQPGAHRFYSTCADITNIRGFRQGRCRMTSCERQRPQSSIAHVWLCATDRASLEPGCSGGLSRASPLASVGSLGFQLPGVFWVARHVLSHQMRCPPPGTAVQNARKNNFHISQHYHQGGYIAVSGLRTRQYSHSFAP